MRRSRAFWGYLAWYAFFGFTATEAVFFFTGNQSTIVGIPRVAWPFFIGFFLTIAKMKFADAVPAGDQIEPWLRVPVLLVEPEVLHQVGVDEAFALNQLIQKHAPLWTDLELVRARIEEKIPTTIATHKRLEFEDKLKKCKSAEDALAEFIRLVTVRWFLVVFSAPPPEQVAAMQRPDMSLQLAPRKSPRSVSIPSPRGDSQRVTPP